MYGLYIFFLGSPGQPAGSTEDVFRASLACSSEASPGREWRDTIGIPLKLGSRYKGYPFTRGTQLQEGSRYKRDPVTRGVPPTRSHDPWSMDYGSWTMVYEPWTMDHGLWPMDHGPWTMDHEPWPMDHGPWTMGHGQWTIYHRP